MLVAVALASALALALILSFGFHLPLYPSWLVALSLVTFALYGFDKRQAVRRGGRVPERVLHGLALLGGFAGGWLGRAVFRHKTRHVSFAFVLLLATVIHGAVLLWLYAL